MTRSHWICTAAACLSLLVVFPAPSAAQACDCSLASSSLCSDQGFRITLLSFNVDQNTSSSTWDYEVCNEKGLGTGCEPPKDLSHIDFNLPGLGTCLTQTQNISLAQIGGFGNVSLACGVSEKDPSCGLSGTAGSDFVAKCDVAGGDLDPGECATMRLTIAGELPTLGPGATFTVTKAGPTCASNCILGPSCESCEEPPTDECLTRTPGFWGTHPHITNLFLPVTVCGKPLSVVTAGSCASATEAMCVAPGKESKGNTNYAQLVRQLTAAKLNLAATAANGGQCGGDVSGVIAQCEALCGASQQQINASGCIEALAAFNESQDTVLVTPAPFDSPGPANPSECQAANGNGLVIGKGACS